MTASYRRGFRSGAALEPEGGTAPRDQPYGVPSVSVAADYLEVMGAELVAGRGFDPADVNTDAVIIDLDLARFLWRGNAVGRRFRMGEDGEWMAVVGVVRELRLLGRNSGRARTRFSIQRPRNARMTGSK